MKRRIKQTFYLFCINLVVFAAAVSAALLFFMRRDPILAALPLVLVFPALLLQPWYLLLFWAGPLFAPVLSTIVSMSIYVLLDRKGKLERAKHLGHRLKNRSTLVFFGGLVVVLVVVAAARLVDFPVLHREVPKTLRFALRDTRIDFGAPRSYCLGGVLDIQWLVQARLPEHEFQALADTLEMVSFPRDQVGDRFPRMPPYWWRPVISDRVRFVATKNFSMTGRGPDGWHAVAAWNPDDLRVHMWIKDNF